jgi:hypothetical protein
VAHSRQVLADDLDDFRTDGGAIPFRGKAERADPRLDLKATR